MIANGGVLEVILHAILRKFNLKLSGIFIALNFMKIVILNLFQ